MNLGCVWAHSYVPLHAQYSVHAHLVPHDRVDARLFIPAGFYQLAPESVQSNLFRPSPSQSHLRLL